MSKYLLVYQGDDRPQLAADARAGRGHDAGLDELGCEGRLRPVRLRRPDRRPHPVGGSGDALPITGYTVVEADSLDDARVLCDGHPFLDEAPADFSVDVYELTPM